MKVRQGFVSNSSSSSFVVSLHDITAIQLDQILNYRETANEPWFKQMLEDEGINDWYEDDYWQVSVEGRELRGDTFMDNFDMHTFMRLIGVDMSKVDFDHS